MKQSAIKKSLAVLAIFLILYSINYFSDGFKIKWPAPAIFTHARTVLFKYSGFFRKVVDEIKKWNQLAKENESLKSENFSLKSEVGLLEVLQKENIFLKKSLGLAGEMNKKVIPGGIYDLYYSPAGYMALINKGERDGVKKNYAAVTADKVLVGIIIEVWPTISKISLSTDQTFSANVKVIHGSTAGIARGIGSDGMRLDLVAQGDEINEGDILVTNGGDLFPSGLIVGTVYQIELNESDLFKKVLLKPAYQDIYLDGIILLPQ